MKPFMDKDFLLQTATAQELYHNHAAKMPIIDYHCHLIPQMVAENKRFERQESLLFADVNVAHPDVLRRKNATFNAQVRQPVSFAGLEAVPFPEKAEYLHLNCFRLWM